MPPSSARSVLVRIAACTLLAAILALGLADPATSHAYLMRSDPMDGSVVSQAPRSLHLDFSEHVVLAATHVEVIDSHGRRTALTGLRLASRDATDTEVPSTITAPLPVLARDAYTVQWATLSSDDLHTTSGTFTFGVETSVAASGFDETKPDPMESGLRWLIDLGLGLVLGSILVSRLIVRVDVGQGARSLLCRTGGVGALVGLLGGVLLVLVELRSTGQSAMVVARTPFGHAWLARETGFLLALVNIRGTARLRDGHGATRACLGVMGGCVLAALGSAQLGHAGAAGPWSVRVIVTVVHLLSVMTWSGGVICLGLVTARAGSRLRTFGRLARSFGTPALVLLGAGIASGLWLAGYTIGSVEALTVTLYGRLLVLKAGLLVVAMVLAAWNHRRVHGPTADAGAGPRGTILGEAALLGMVLLSAAALAGGQPANEPQLVSQDAPTDGPITFRSADLQLALDVSPGRAGRNVVTVDALETRRPAPGEITGVTIAVGSGPDLGMVPLQEGRWELPGIDLSPGSAPIAVRIVRPGLRTVVASNRWVVGADGAPARSWRTQPATPGFEALTFLAATASAMGLAIGWRRRRRLFVASAASAASAASRASRRVG